MGYIPGDFWRICERTGFKVRASHTSKEWTGSIVRDVSWEPRHPQDFVRGRPDDQRVVDPRPRPTDVFSGPVDTTLAQTTAPGTNVLVLTSIAGFDLDEDVGVMLDSGDVFRTHILAIIGNTVYLDDNLPSTAAAGNVVYAYGVSTVVLNDVNYDFTDRRNNHHLPVV